MKESYGNRFEKSGKWVPFKKRRKLLILLKNNGLYDLYHVVYCLLSILIHMHLIFMLLIGGEVGVGTAEYKFETQSISFR